MPYKLTQAGRMLVFSLSSFFLNILFSLCPFVLYYYLPFVPFLTAIGLYYVLNFAMFIFLYIYRITEWETIDKQDTLWYSILRTAAPVISTCVISLKSLSSIKLIQLVEKPKRKQKNTFSSYDKVNLGKNSYGYFNHSDEFEYIEQMQERLEAQYDIIEEAIKQGYLSNDSILEFKDELEIVPLESLVNKNNAN